MSMLVNYANSDDSSDDISDTFDDQSNASPKLDNSYQSNVNLHSFLDPIKKDNENPIKYNQTLSDIFTNLPAPVNDSNNINEPEMIILPSKFEIGLREKPPEKKKIVINLPVIDDSESENENEEGPSIKRIKKGSKCDLFNLLPTPKASSAKELNRSLVPHVVSSRQKNSSSLNSSSLTKPSSSCANPMSGIPIIPESLDILPMRQPSRTQLLEYRSDTEDEDGDNNQFNFFSIADNSDKIDSVENYGLIHLSTFNCGKNANNCSTILDKDCSNTSVNFNIKNNDNGGFSKTRVNNNLSNFTPEHSLIGKGSTNVQSLSYDSEGQSRTQLMDAGDLQDDRLSKDYLDAAQSYTLEVDEKFLGPMVGPSRDYYPQQSEFESSGGRSFADFDPDDIIEARVDDFTAGYQLQKVKDLTQEQNRISYSKKHNKDMPTSQQKRKHQITFLAYEAKERELELKNQWAENRFTKKQTQSKYGF